MHESCSMRVVGFRSAQDAVHGAQKKLPAAPVVHAAIGGSFGVLL